MSEQNGSVIRLESVEIENVKRLKAVQIDCRDNVVIVGGVNRAGKSSALDAVAMAFGGKKLVPSKPIRDGNDKACVRVELDNGLVVERRFWRASNGKDIRSKVEIRSKEGYLAPSPQDMLDTLMSGSKIGFDPLSFARAKQSEQAKLLQQAVGIDLDAIEQEEKELREERTVVGRSQKLKESAAKLVIVEDDLPEEPVDISDLQKQLSEAYDHNSKRSGLEATLSTAEEKLRSEKERLDNYVDGKEKIEEEISSLETRIAGLKNRLKKALVIIEDQQKDVEQAESQVEKAKQQVDAHNDIDTSEISAMIGDAEKINTSIGERKKRDALLLEAKELAEEYDGLTSKIEEKIRERDEAIAGADYPVPGLGYQDGCVMLNGLPFDQAATSEQIRVGCAIAFSLEPVLRVMLVRDGSLMGDEEMAAIREMAERYKATVLVEYAMRNAQDDVGATVVIEDGQVVGQDASEIAKDIDEKQRQEDALTAEVDGD